MAKKVDTEGIVYNRFNRPPAAGFVCEEPSLTHQEFKDECDINRIMARALKTGQMPVVPNAGRYGDFAAVGDYHAAQEMLLKSRAMFDALPSNVRERFRNDPAELLAWVSDPRTSLEEAQKLGLLRDEAVARLEAAKAAKVEPAKP